MGLFSEVAKNAMLDGLTGSTAPDLIKLHSGDPGASGTSNEITGGGYAPQAATFSAASGGSRALASAVNFSATAGQSITWVSIWHNDTADVYLGKHQLGAGDDLTANAAGEYTVTTSTVLTLSDPA